MRNKIRQEKVEAIAAPLYETVATAWEACAMAMELVEARKSISEIRKVLREWEESDLSPGEDNYAIERVSSILDITRKKQ